MVALVRIKGATRQRGLELRVFANSTTFLDSVCTVYCLVIMAAACSRRNRRSSHGRTCERITLAASCKANRGVLQCYTDLSGTLFRHALRGGHAVGRAVHSQHGARKARVDAVLMQWQQRASSVERLGLTNAVMATPTSSSTVAAALARAPPAISASASSPRRRHQRCRRRRHRRRRRRRRRPCRPVTFRLPGATT